MASVALAKAYLHEAADPRSFLALYTDGPAHEPSQAGEVRMMANGRRRIVTGAQRRVILAPTFPQVSDGELFQLEEWRGALLCYRDVFKRLHFGSFFSCPATPWKDRDGWSVTVTFEEVTYSIEPDAELSVTGFVTLS